MVRKGQPLYQIDAAPYRAALDQAKAQLANAQALVVTDKAKADRYGDLVKINAVAQTGLRRRALRGTARPRRRWRSNAPRWRALRSTWATPA